MYPSSQITAPQIGRAIRILGGLSHCEILLSAFQGDIYLTSVLWRLARHFRHAWWFIPAAFVALTRRIEVAFLATMRRMIAVVVFLRSFGLFVDARHKVLPRSRE
jgi:hypothetical protein